ncbi:MAG: deoxyribose-phosphate aldolase [Candidatus Hydrogenedentes bacterium]|nr:deoxyribose-phosphate aldolase [Candidatus Hydrogenedentota bacterium]
MIDHTLLHAFATEIDIRELCEEARLFEFRAVSVNPVWVAFCSKILSDSDVKIDACVAFPLGAATARMKIEEARDAVQNGAAEIDMVINIGALKSGYAHYVEKEITAVVKAMQEHPVKVILETSYLDNDEKTAVCEMCVRAGAAFVKTATGFGKGGATVEDVKLMRKVVGRDMGIKAAGGIRTYRDAMRFIEAGATCIGTSAGIAILEDIPE